MAFTVFDKIVLTGRLQMAALPFFPSSDIAIENFLVATLVRIQRRFERPELLVQFLLQHSFLGSGLR